MCGIAGIMQRERVEPAMVERLCATLRHRGPDDTGVHVEGGVGLGMTRLAIIDIAGGHQPMQSSDGTVTLVFNGEIYNYRELRAELEGHWPFHSRSDTEVILNGYLQWGDAVLARLNGIFAIALWDRRRGSLLLARDPMGVKPLYYSRADGRLVFASELKTFTGCGLARRISPAAVRQFLSAGYTFHPGTPLDGVLALEPGHSLRIDAGGAVEERPFVDLRAEPGNLPEREVAPALRDAIEAAVLRQTVADVPIGLLLSSGLDSTYLLGIMRKHGLTEHLNTYTVVYDDEAFSEGDSVARLTREWGIRNDMLRVDGRMVADNLERIADVFDGLEILPTAVAMLLVSERASRHNKVVFSGIGGDELFYGYPTYRATDFLVRHPHLAKAAGPMLGWLSRLPANRGYLPLGEKAGRLREGCRHSPELAHLAWRHVFVREEIDGLLLRDRAGGAEAIYAPQLAYYDQARRAGHVDMDAFGYVDFKTWLVDCCLSMWDKAGMASSLEIRVPLLDLELVRAVHSLPPAIRHRQLGSKYLLRQLAAEVLPPHILDNRKRGFQVPLGKWLLGPLADPFRQLTDALPRDIFDQQAIGALWEAQRQGRQGAALKLWSLGMLSLWMTRHKVSW